MRKQKENNTKRHAIKNTRTMLKNINAAVTNEVRLARA